ncbi:MAG TPA: MFS transporter, partial [Chloroflexota bacterium]|nr:MFS transporter [Chloroflexota bacterium]
NAGSGAYAALLADRRIRLLLLTAFLLHGGMHLGLSFAPLYLGEVYGWDRARVGWMGSAASTGTVVLLLTMERFRRRFGAVPAAWLSAGSMAAHFACTIASGTLPVQAVGFLCRGGFQSMATLTTVAMTEAVPRARVAPAIALLATVAAGAAIAAPPVGGWLFARTPALTFVAGIAVLALSAPLVPVALRPRRTGDAARAPARAVDQPEPLRAVHAD